MELCLAHKKERKLSVRSRSSQPKKNRISISKSYVRMQSFLKNITFITARLNSVTIIPQMTAIPRTIAVIVICVLKFSQFLTGLFDTKYKVIPVSYCSRFEQSKTLRFKQRRNIARLLISVHKMYMLNECFSVAWILFIMNYLYISSIIINFIK